MELKENEAGLLTVSSHSRPNGIQIEAVGDVDLYSVDRLASAVMAGVTQISDSPEQILTVDLRRVDFIDSAGLALLIRARKNLADTQKPLHVLLKAGTQPERVLKLGKFDTVLHFLYDAK